MSDFPNTPSYGVASSSGLPGLSDRRDSLLNQPFAMQVNLPPSPIQQMQQQIGTPMVGPGSAPPQGLPPAPQSAPTSTLQGLQQAAPLLQSATGVAPPVVMNPYLAASAEGANANAQIANMPTVPTYQPYTPAPYPTPQFAPIPERGPPPAVPGPIGAFSALASLFAGPYAGDVAASPLLASKAIGEQQYQDALQRYQAQEAQDVLRNGFAEAGYNVNNAAGIANNAGANSQAEQEYKQGLAIAALKGNAAAAQELQARYPGYISQVVAAQQAEAQAGNLERQGIAGTQATGAAQTQTNFDTEQAAQLHALQNRYQMFKEGLNAENLRFGQGQSGEMIRAMMAQIGENQRLATSQEGENARQDKELKTRVSLALLSRVAKGGIAGDYGDVMEKVVKDPYVKSAMDQYHILNDQYAKATRPEDLVSLGSKRDQQRIIVDQTIQAAIGRYGGKPAAAQGLPGFSASPGQTATPPGGVAPADLGNYTIRRRPQ